MQLLWMYMGHESEYAVAVSHRLITAIPIQERAHPVGHSTCTFFAQNCCCNTNYGIAQSGTCDSHVHDNECTQPCFVATFAHLGTALVAHSPINRKPEDPSRHVPMSCVSISGTRSFQTANLADSSDVGESFQDAPSYLLGRHRSVRCSPVRLLHARRSHALLMPWRLSLVSTAEAVHTCVPIYESC